MSACLALRKDFGSCRQYAREGHFTCRQHAHFFSDPKVWLDKILYTYHTGHLQTIESHMDYALSCGAIKITADMLRRTSDILFWRDKPPTRLPRQPSVQGSTYLILLRHCPDISPSINHTLFFRASRTVARSLVSWHNRFASIDDIPIPNTKGILETFWKRAVYPILRNDTEHLANFQMFLELFYSGEPTLQSRTIWRSFLENYLAEFGDHPIVEKRVWSEVKSFDPVFATYTRNRFWHTYAEIHMEIWATYRATERAKILKAAKERCAVYKEDLIAFGWHPDRLLDWCLDVEELADLREHWSLVK